MKSDKLGATRSSAASRTRRAAVSAGEQVSGSSNSGRPNSSVAQFNQSLESLRHEEAIGDVRGIGLLGGVEFVADKASKRSFPPAKNFAGRVAAASMKRGLLVYPMQGSVDGISGDHLLLAPPAIITGEQILCAAEQLRAAVLEGLASL